MWWRRGGFKFVLFLRILLFLNNTSILPTSIWSGWVDGGVGGWGVTKLVIFYEGRKRITPFRKCRIEFSFS